MAARQAAEKRLSRMQAAAAECEQAGLESQLAAARLRLVRELGHYLACLDQGVDDLNGLLYEHSLRDNPSAQRLQRCLECIGGYPDWDPELVRELRAFSQIVTPARRQGRLIGKELDAALEDPRWQAGRVA